jgi:DNA helicase HerA-like ATPase
MTDKARVCVVYEEAHSLVPEWNSAVDEGDQTASNGSARAILQGRKYGLGCLLITQRTANVTKTILNQCNTIFAMRTFDDTGKNFLANYMGMDYANSLSSLSERHAVLFGKASSCENPILIRLNDRDKFVQAFRAENPPPPLPAVDEPGESPETAPPAEPASNSSADDIPF